MSNVMSGRNVAAEKVMWYFGEYPEDGEVWLAHPDLTLAYVDFRLRGASPGQWRRVAVVTHGWVRRRLGDGAGGAASWPPLLVVPDGTPAEIRAWITQMVEAGGSILEANSDALPTGWQPTTTPRPAHEY